MGEHGSAGDGLRHADQVLQRQAEPPGGVRHAAPAREEPGHAEPEPARFRESGEDGVAGIEPAVGPLRGMRGSAACTPSPGRGPTRAFAAPPHVPRFPPHASTATARSVVSVSAAPSELERIVNGTVVCAERSAFPAVRLADRSPGAADLAQRPARRTSTQSTSRTTSHAIRA